MQKAFMKMTLAVLASALTACSSMQGMPTMPGFGTGSEGSQQQQGLVGTSVDQTGKETNVNITMAGGGEIGLKSMDANDKTKMSRALDAATGKATHWENGISESIIPSRQSARW